MYMNPNVRRAFVRLNAIPVEARARTQLFYVFEYQHNSGTVREVKEEPVHFDAVSMDQNRASFTHINGTFRVPLMDVIDVWDFAPNTWAIRVAGMLELNTTAAPIRYRPLA